MQAIKQHSSTISSQLRPFVESLQSFIRQYEEIIVKISSTLPEIEDRIDDNILEARELLNFLFSKAADEELYGVKREIVRFHTQLNSILADLTEMNAQDKKILSGLKESIEISNTAIQKMASIYEISESLKVYAINSIVSAQKAGERGRGYQVISTEFIKLSEHIASGTREIITISIEVEKEIKDFLNTVKSLESYSREQIEFVSSDSREILQKANKSIENFSEILNDLFNRIEDSKNPTYEIMVELQKQDIIHQQLIHLVENIDDILIILEENSRTLDLPIEDMTEEEKQENRSLYTLLIFLIDNTENQISRISIDFLQMVDTLERLFSIMNNSILDIDSDKSEFSRIILKQERQSPDTSKNIQDASVESYIFDTPSDLINSMRNSIQDLEKRKKEILHTFLQVETKIALEKTHAQSYLPIIDSINNLLLLSRIEQARHNLDISITGGSTEDTFFRDSFSDLSGMIEEIEKTHSMMLNELDATSLIFSKQGIRYKTMDTQFQESINVLMETKRIFLDHFSAVMGLTSELVQEISDYTHLFKELRLLDTKIQQKVTVCTDIKDSVEQKVQQLGGAIPLSSCNFKEVIYQKIVDKCTVEQERETISKNFTDLEIEESAGSSITLF